MFFSGKFKKRRKNVLFIIHIRQTAVAWHWNDCKLSQGWPVIVSILTKAISWSQTDFTIHPSPPPLQYPSAYFGPRSWARYRRLPAPRAMQRKEGWQFFTGTFRNSFEIVLTRATRFSVPLDTWGPCGSQRERPSAQCVTIPAQNLSIGNELLLMLALTYLKHCWT